MLESEVIVEVSKVAPSVPRRFFLRGRCGELGEPVRFFLMATKLVPHGTSSWPQSWLNRLKFVTNHGLTALTALTALIAI